MLPRFLCAWAFAASFAFAVDSVAAALPGAPAAKPAAEAASPQPTAEDVARQLAEARRQAALVDASPGYALNAPPEASDEERKLRRFFLHEIVRGLESWQRNLARREELRQSLQIARQEGERLALDGGPPFSVLVADQLAEEADAAKSRMDSLRARQDLLREIRETVSGNAKATAAELRVAEEQAALVDGSRRMAERWRVELLRHRLRAQSVNLLTFDTSVEINQLQMALAGQVLDLARQRVETVRGKVAFPESDYEEVRRGLAAARSAYTSKLSQAVDRNALAIARLEAAQQALAAHGAMAGEEGGSDPGRPAALARLQQERAIAETDVESAGQQMDLDRYLSPVFEIQRMLWDSRYRLYQQRSPDLIADVRRQVADASRNLALIEKVFERKRATLGAEVDEAERLLNSAVNPGDRQLRDYQLNALQAREALLRQAGGQLLAVSALADRVVAEAGGRAADAGLRAQLDVAGAGLGKLLGSLADFELFAVEDTIEVDGKKVSGYASVTVGKVVRAVVIFAVAILLIVWLGRATENLVVRRFGYDPARARILRKWLFALGMMVTLVAVLVWVRIPLTIFAFLGGAVAIGLGFGMQTVLKNLISGLMLLFERPFQPGDLIEVGAVLGNVTEIGIRSTVIRDVNGVETLIPNSVFVEQSVTNWTYENACVRYCIRIGVAYGEPVQRVSRLLEECVCRHGLVLKEPEPEILFENFGNDALEFGIYYWLEIGPKVSNRRVSSDLRFMIEKALAENGVVIAYPQRDVHLDAAEPLRVEVVSRPVRRGGRRAVR